MKNNQGQIALITVFTSVVVFTVGIATASRITADVKLASRTEEAEQAIAAAEAGLEEALLDYKNGTLIPGTSGFEDITAQVAPLPTPASNVARYQTTVTELPDTTSYELGSVKVGDAKTVWLIDNYDPNTVVLDYTSIQTLNPYSGVVRLNWEPAASGVELSVYYIDALDQLQVKRSYVSFGSTSTLDLSTLLPVNPPTNALGLFIRVRPVLNDITKLTVSGYDTANFHLQGYKIEVLGRTTLNEVSRKIEAIRMREDYETFLDFGMYSDGDITIQ